MKNQCRTTEKKTWQDYLNDIRNGVPFNKEDDELDDLINSLEE